MVKNLLFDLGGVIMNIRRQNAVDALVKIGMSDADSFLGDYAQQGPFLKLEEGKLSEGEFRAEIRALIPNPVTDAPMLFASFSLAYLSIALRHLSGYTKSIKSICCLTLTR